MPIPEFNENGQWDGISKSLQPTTKDEYFELIDQLIKDSGHRFTIVEALDALGICAASFITPLVAWIARLESAASAYHVLPAEGGILAQPLWLFEGFEVVRRARDDYYSWKRKHMRGKA